MALLILLGLILIVAALPGVGFGLAALIVIGILVVDSLFFRSP